MAKAKEETKKTPALLCDDKDFSQIEAGIRFAFSRPSTAAKATIAFLDKLRTLGGAAPVVDDSAVKELESKVSAMEVTIAELKVELNKLKKA